MDLARQAFSTSACPSKACVASVKATTIVKKPQLSIMMTLGAHVQDPHVSFYHFSPGGFAFEVITELEPWHNDGFELNPEKLSTWGHELVGPILGAGVRAPEEVLDEEGLAILNRLRQSA